MADFLQVMTTLAEREDAERIAGQLVEMRLAACVQVIGPIRSFYRWQGKVESSEEWLCVAKTHRDRYAEVEAAILAEHPYELPEIIATELAAGSAAYLNWLEEQLQPE